MKILIIPQYSMRSYKEDKWIVDKDSHFDEILSIIKGINLLNDSTINIDCIIPSKTTPYKYLIEKVYEINRVNFIKKEFAVNILLERANFDLFWWQNLLCNKKYDLIINNNDVITKNIYWVIKQNNLSTKINLLIDHMPFYYWSEMDSKTTTFYRILESAKSADKVFTFLYETKAILSNLCDVNVFKLPSFSVNILNKYACNKRNNNDIFLISRLSDKKKINLDAIMKFSEQLKVKLYSANPNDVSNVYIEELKFERKDAFLKTLSTFHYVPFTFNTSLIMSTGYIQSTFYECETELFRKYDSVYLKHKKESFIKLHSIEDNLTQIQNLIDV